MKATTRKAFVALVAAAVSAGLLRLQANVAPDGAYSYKGLLPGKSTFDEVQAALGPAPIKTSSPRDLRYPSDGGAVDNSVNDRLYFRGDTLALVTSGSRDARYPTSAAIVAAVGEPESHVWFQTQQFLDYTERGLRFISDADGKTTGSIHFPPGRRRMPAGYPAARIDLRRKLAPPQPADPPRDFRVGAAQLSISPKTFAGLLDPKYPEPKLAEDLFARAAVFERGETRIALIGLDVFGLGDWDVQRALKALAGKGFQDVVIAMSHTHANVDTIGFYGYYPRDYARFVMEQVVVAVEAAAKAARPISSLRTGTTEMPLDGGRVVDLIRNGRDPGIVNPAVSVLQAIGTDARPVVNVVHLACHPEVIDLGKTGGLSPDFVGRLCRDVSRELGGTTVFLNGALGGMVTPDARDRTQDEAERVGHELSRFIVRAAANAVPSGSYDLWRFRRPVEYPITGETVLKFLEKPPEPVEMYQGRVSAEMNLLWIGDAQFITVPGELLPEIGFEIEAKMTGRVRAIVGLANGELGYLVPSYDFRAGGYEERTGPGAAGGEITRSVGLELAPMLPPGRKN